MENDIRRTLFGKITKRKMRPIV